MKKKVREREREREDQPISLIKNISQSSHFLHRKLKDNSNVFN